LETPSTTIYLSKLENQILFMQIIQEADRTESMDIFGVFQQRVFIILMYRKSRGKTVVEK